MNASFTYSINEIDHAAQFVIEHMQYPIVTFYGGMGVGKTTLIGAICKHYGVKDHITSPTFSLVNEYLSDKNNRIYHFDFYRINSIDEAYDIGVEEYLYSNNMCLIEWPELITAILADIPQTQVRIEQLDEWNRQLTITNQIA